MTPEVELAVLKCNRYSKGGGDSLSVAIQDVLKALRTLDAENKELRRVATSKFEEALNEVRAYQGEDENTPGPVKDLCDCLKEGIAAIVVHNQTGDVIHWNVSPNEKS